MRRRQTLAVAAAVLLAGATLLAAKVKVSTQAEPDFDFRPMKTFDFTKQPTDIVRTYRDAPEPDPKLVATFDARIKGAVSRELEKKGWRRVEDGTADALFGFRVAVGPNSSSTVMGQFLNWQLVWAVPPVGPGTSYVRFYEEGTLLVGLVAGDPKRVVWYGAASAEVDRDAEMEKRLRRIDDAIKEMFKKFPPKPGK